MPHNILLFRAGMIGCEGGGWGYFAFILRHLLFSLECLQEKGENYLPLATTQF